MRKPIDDDEDENMEFNVYPQVDPKDGSVVVEDDLGDLCLQIDGIEQMQELSERNQGVWDTVCTIMATPLVKLNETLEEILSTVIAEERAALDGLTDDEEEEQEMHQANIKDVTIHNKPAVNTTVINKKTGEITTGKEVELIEDDISDEDLLAEFEREKTKSAYPYSDAYCGYGYD